MKLLLCALALAATTAKLDFTDHAQVNKAWRAGELTATKKAKSANECGADETYFLCQQKSTSTDGFDYCGRNYECPLNPIFAKAWTANNKPGDRVNGNCCFCGGCIKHTPKTTASTKSPPTKSPAKEEAKLTLQTSDQDAKDAAVISWDGTNLDIPQHTDELKNHAAQLNTINEALEKMQDEINEVNNTVTKTSEALETLDGTVGGLEQRWTAAITVAVEELKVEEVKKTAEQGVKDAAAALSEAEHATEIAEANEEDVTNLAEQVEGNAEEIQQNEDNVAANAEDIATNEKNIKGKACRKGTYRSPTNDAECIRCARGQYTDQAGAEGKCKGNKCAKGKYNPYDAATTPAAAYCLTCQSGKFTDALASASCKGTVCAKGTWHPDGQRQAHTCHNCAKGKYNSQTGRTHISHCKSCSSGKSSDKLAATLSSDCKSCSKGRYADWWGLAVCKACGKGRFNDQTARWSASQCKACGKGRYGDQTARTMSSQCKACASGKYNPNSVRTSPCASCTDTGSCPYGKVKFQGKSCTSTQNQVCKVKWDSWSSYRKCTAGASWSCSSIQQRCESLSKCYGIQKRNWRTQSCSGGYWKYSWCWGWCNPWKYVSRTCRSSNHEACHLCTANSASYSTNSEYKFRDYNKW